MDSATTAPESASPSRIRGRRWLLFNVDLDREIARPLCMGRSRDWLMLRARLLPYPAVVEIDATEATEIARRGVLTIDYTTVAELARQWPMLENAHAKHGQGHFARGRSGSASA